MDSEDDGPFAAVTKLRHYSSSQEVVLRNCPFARASKAFDEGDSDGGGSPENYETQLESTGILMVSPPETTMEDTPQDEFHTAPEDSLPFSSDEQIIETTDDNADQGIDDEIMAIDGGTDDGREVDLGKYLDLGFSEAKPVDCIPGVLEGEACSEVSIESPSKLCEANLMVESFVAVRNNSKESDGVLGSGKGTAKEDSTAKEGEECAENGATNGDVREAHELQSNIEMGIGGRRRLPPSVCGRKENAEWEGELASGISSTEKGFLMGVLDVLKTLAGKSDDPSINNADMFELVKSRGMTFPRPSWWPPEGFEEK